MKIRDIIVEYASEGTTPAAAVSSGTPVAAHSGGTSYTGKPGKSGTKAPKQAKVVQKKKPDGTATPAHELPAKGGLMGGQGLIKRSN